MYVPDFLYKSCVAGQPVEFVLDEVFVMSPQYNNQGRGKYHLPIKHWCFKEKKEKRIMSKKQIN